MKTLESSITNLQETHGKKLDAILEMMNSNITNLEEKVMESKKSNNISVSD